MSNTDYKDYTLRKLLAEHPNDVGLLQEAARRFQVLPTKIEKVRGLLEDIHEIRKELNIRFDELARELEIG